MQEIHRQRPIEPDFYGERGTVDALLKKFMEITGKEAAIYMPSGTLANQLAIQVLAGRTPRSSYRRPVMFSAMRPMLRRPSTVNG